MGLRFLAHSRLALRLYASPLVVDIVALLKVEVKNRFYGRPGASNDRCEIAA
jgi:hypothetical protein